jgi:hypothetical protein
LSTTYISVIELLLTEGGGGGAVGVFRIMSALPPCNPAIIGINISEEDAASITRVVLGHVPAYVCPYTLYPAMKQKVRQLPGLTS